MADINSNSWPNKSVQIDRPQGFAPLYNIKQARQSPPIIEPEETIQSAKIQAYQDGQILDPGKSRLLRNKYQVTKLLDTNERKPNIDEALVFNPRAKIQLAPLLDRQAADAQAVFANPRRQDKGTNNEELGRQSVCIQVPKGPHADDILLDKALADFEREYEKESGSKSNILIVGSNRVDCQLKATRMLLLAAAETRQTLYSHMEILDANNLHDQAKTHEPRIIFVAGKTLTGSAGLKGSKRSAPRAAAKRETEKTSKKKTAAKASVCNLLKKFGENANLEKVKYLYFDATQEYLAKESQDTFHFLRNHIKHDPSDPAQILATAHCDHERGANGDSLSLKSWFPFYLYANSPQEFRDEGLMPDLETIPYQTKIGEATAEDKRQQKALAKPANKKATRLDEEPNNTIQTVSFSKDLLGPTRIGGTVNEIYAGYETLVAEFDRLNARKPKRVFIKAQTRKLALKLYNKFRASGVKVARTHSLGVKKASDIQTITEEHEIAGAKAAGNTAELNVFTDATTQTGANNCHYAKDRLELLRAFGKKDGYEVLIHCDSLDGLEIPADCIMLACKPIVDSDKAEKYLAPVLCQNRSHPQANDDITKLVWLTQKSLRIDNPITVEEVVKGIEKNHGENHDIELRRIAVSDNRNGGGSTEAAKTRGTYDGDEDGIGQSALFTGAKEWQEFLHRQIVKSLGFATVQEGLEILADSYLESATAIESETLPSTDEVIDMLEGKLRSHPRAHDVIRSLRKEFGKDEFIEIIQRFPQYTGIINQTEASLRLHHMLNEHLANKDTETAWLATLNRENYPSITGIENYQQFIAKYLLQLNQTGENRDLLIDPTITLRYVDIILGLSDSFRGLKKPADAIFNDFYKFAQRESQHILPVTVARQDCFPNRVHFRNSITNPQQAFENTAYIINNEGIQGNPKWLQVINRIKPQGLNPFGLRQSSNQERLITDFLYNKGYRTRAYQSPEDLQNHVEVLLGASDSLNDNTEAATRLRQAFFKYLKTQHQGLNLAEVENIYPGINSLEDDFKTEASLITLVSDTMAENKLDKLQEKPWTDLLEASSPETDKAKLRAETIARFIYNNEDLKKKAANSIDDLTAIITACLQPKQARNATIFTRFLKDLSKNQELYIRPILLERAYPRLIKLADITKDLEGISDVVDYLIENNGVVKNDPWLELLEPLKPKLTPPGFKADISQRAQMIAGFLDQNRRLACFNTYTELQETCSVLMGGILGNKKGRTPQQRQVLNEFISSLDHNYQPALSPMSLIELFPNDTRLEELIDTESKLLPVISKNLASLSENADSGWLEAIDRARVPGVPPPTRNADPEAKLARRARVINKFLYDNLIKADADTRKSVSNIEKAIAVCLGYGRCLRSATELPPTKLFEKFNTFINADNKLAHSLYPEAIKIDSSDNTAIQAAVNALLENGTIQETQLNWTNLLNTALQSTSSTLNPDALRLARAGLVADYLAESANGQKYQHLASLLLKGPNDQDDLLQGFIDFLQRKYPDTLTNIALHRIFNFVTVSEQEVRDAVTTAISKEDFLRDYKHDRTNAKYKNDQRPSFEGFYQKVQQITGCDLDELARIFPIEHRDVQFYSDPINMIIAHKRPKPKDEFHLADSNNSQVKSFAKDTIEKGNKTRLLKWQQETKDMRRLMMTILNEADLTQRHKERAVLEEIYRPDGYPRNRPNPSIESDNVRGLIELLDASPSRQKTCIFFVCDDELSLYEGTNQGLELVYLKSQAKWATKAEAEVEVQKVQDLFRNSAQHDPLVLIQALKSLVCDGNLPDHLTVLADILLAKSTQRD